MLEIGCGPGIATALFAAKGCRIHALDPGEDLITLARHKLQAFPSVTFEVSSFEAAALPENYFALVVAAQSFHWVDPTLGLTKVTQVLRPGGSLALFWNQSMLDEGTLRERFDVAYHACFGPPKDTLVWHERLQQSIAARRGRLNAHPGLSDVDVHIYRWSKTYTADAYIQLIGTYSDHSTLPSMKKKRLFDAIHEAIMQEGGSFDMPYATTLFMARH